MNSLEAALRYNPSSVELMASLAEVYVRLGRFDDRTLELCEQVLSRQVDNVLLQQAQSIGILIDQARTIEQGLSEGKEPPDHEALSSSLQTLDDFLSQSGECVDAWIAWTRFQILALQFNPAAVGIERLVRLDVRGLDEMFHNSLQHVAQRQDLTPEQAGGLAELFMKVGSATAAMKLFEKLYDQGNAAVMKLFEKLYDQGNAAVGPSLLDLYLNRYSINQASELPEVLRNRLFKLLLDHGNPELTGQWLRKASVMGWQVTEFSNSYAQMLIEMGELDEAFGVLQRVAMDPNVRRMLNEVSTSYEQRDEVEKAVAVLRYLNEYELEDSDQQLVKESELVRDAQLSMAELQLRNGRHGEALEKYIAALCLSPEVDLSILMQIDELLEIPGVADSESLLRLGLYFRQRLDMPKALFYLNQACEIDPGNSEVLGELESMFVDILQKNPDLPQIRYELGKLHLRVGRNEEALRELTLAAASPTMAQEANRLLARLMMSNGQLTEALDKFRGLRVDEDDFEPIYDLHVAFADRQAWREAYTALDLIARVSPTWRDVGEKIRLYEDRIGKLQPEIVADPKMRELIGDLAVGRYQYLERLGSGGMGVVHKVYDIRNKQTVAMKILRDNLSGSSKALDRFFREARIAATLNHKNIVNIFDYNISNVSGQSYIVMEYVDGPSLREIIDRQFNNTISISLEYVAEILYYSVQLCDALQASHVKGIVHRDIKPDNIMINGRGEVKITDFGIVHIEEATFTPTGAMLGTPRYMSPEQVTGGKIDGRTDIYSVGILLYEVLTGSPPFLSGDISYQQVNNHPTPVRDINPTIPQQVADAVMKCLNKKPEDRYSDALLLKRELNDALEGVGGCSKYNKGNSTEIFEPSQLGHETELDLH